MAEYLVDCNPKAIPPDQYKCLFGRFLEEYELLQVQKLLSLDGGCDEHYSVEIQSQDLTHFDSALSYSVLHYPKLLIPLFEEALLELQKEIMKQLSGDQLCRVKVQCHIRILSLPSIPEFSKRTISDVKAHETNAFVQVTGTVVRTGGVRMLEQSKQYECQNAKCRFRFTVCADPEQENMLPQPRCCPAKATTAGSSYESKCNSSNVRELEGGSVCVDYQEIKIQDHLERLSLGSVPRSIVVILLCDLVDRFNPGDDVVVVGTVLRQWRPVSRGARCVVDVAVEACSITVLGGRESIHNASQTSVAQFAHFWASRLGDSNSIFQARNDIVRAVCPQLFGMFYVKLSLLLALIGGNSTVYEGGVRRRSQSHMLIVGDPGCGKSQLLRFAASVVPRSVLTTGIGTTGAGLTCTAVREGNDWCLEAGALVLSNDGVCCIDEFASIREADRATIHEAMEQQTVSVAKAGLVVKLNTRATVIACCNPKGAYDVSADLSANTAIASPLLSRFDLILVLMDTASKDWDTQVSTFLLLQAVAGGVKSSADQSVDQDSPSLSSEIWSLETLRQYVTCVKACVHPEMTAEARCLLMRYYQLQRQSDERSSTRTTVRLLESLLRLSEAHAKLMFRNRVTSIDAIVAIHCVSLANPQESSMLDSVSSVKDGFSNNPANQFAHIERHVMSMLHYSTEALARDCLQQSSQTSVGGETNHGLNSNCQTSALGKRSFKFPEYDVAGSNISAHHHTTWTTDTGQTSNSFSANDELSTVSDFTVEEPKGGIDCWKRTRSLEETSFERIGTTTAAAAAPVSILNSGLTDIAADEQKVSLSTATFTLLMDDEDW